LEIDRDITERKRAQEELQKAHDKLEENVHQRTSDLQRANRMLRMISMCDQAVVQISDERELMQVICQIIQDESGYPLVWVGLAENENTNTVRCAALAGDHDDFIEGKGATAGDCTPESDPAGMAIGSGAPVVWDDIARQCGCPSLREAALRKGFRSLAALPLMNARRAAFGALVIYSERLPGFDQGNIDLLKELVDDLAFGIMSLRARAERDQAQLALEIKASQLQILAAELVRSEERERRRIAQLLHDQLQQLLAAVLYGLESLRTAPGDAAVQEGVTKLSGLLRECIDMSHSLTSELSHPALSEPDLRAALQWLASWAREKHGLEVEVEAAEALIIASEETRIMLLQAVRELLFNVVKHAGVKAARVHLRRARDGRVLITVSDEGVGFDPVKMNGLGKASSGIGLFSIRERLALTGGGMELECTPGRGSSFTLWVPAAIAGPPPEPDTPLAPGRVDKRGARAKSKKPRRRASQKGEGRIRVLLVDDHIVVRDGLAVQLRQQPDIEIVGEASDGMTAVDLVRGLRPDVVTMDVNMPGMNGIEATRAILAELPGLSVIGLSMFEGAEKAAAMRAAGAVNYLSKSASFDSLLAAIRACARNT
jgi:signal transduction histidine kinase/ActR/RegA family two-component response regulator